MNDSKPRRTIDHDGQAYYDEPIMAHPLRRSIIEDSVARAFKSPMARPLEIGLERVRLRWMKPDGKGGLEPKYPKREA